MQTAGAPRKTVDIMEGKSNRGIFLINPLTWMGRWQYTISVKSDMVRGLEKVLKAAADRNRLRIINMLQARPLCVCEITAVLGLSQSTVSGHLRVLRDAGLVLDDKSGLWVEYRLGGGDEIGERLIKLIHARLGSDPVMQRERSRAQKVDRRVLCRR